MNKYAKLAISHWQHTDPDRYARFPDPEAFFTQLGERAQIEIPAAARRARGTRPAGRELPGEGRAHERGPAVGRGAGPRGVDPDFRAGSQRRTRSWRRTSPRPGTFELMRELAKLGQAEEQLGRRPAFCADAGASSGRPARGRQRAFKRCGWCARLSASSARRALRSCASDCVKRVRGGVGAVWPAALGVGGRSRAIGARRTTINAHYTDPAPRCSPRSSSGPTANCPPARSIGSPSAQPPACRSSCPPRRAPPEPRAPLMGPSAAGNSAASASNDSSPGRFTPSAPCC